MGVSRVSCRVVAFAGLGALVSACPRADEPTPSADRAPEPSDKAPSDKAPSDKAPSDKAPGDKAADEPVGLPRFRLSIVGINDLHGHVERLPVYAGYLANLRSAGFKTVVVDAGDMFQGTLASNLGEGDAVVAAYNEMGVAAAAIGNHEFDFGPVGADATVTADGSKGQDPQGALKARAAEATFPFLASNIIDETTGDLIAWEGVSSSAIVERGMIKVGIVGATTMGTPSSTLAPNFAGLRMAPLAAALEREARALRERGAHVVVAAVHAGASCEAFDDPDDLSSCDLDDEVTAAVRTLPAGLIDVVVAGHTHRAMAHRVNGTAIIQQYAYGRALGRVDLHLQQRNLGVADVVIHPPRDLCAGPGEPCKPGRYEGAPVVADDSIEALLEPFIERSRELQARRLGLVLTGPIERSYASESALGNLFSDALLARTDGADVALSNGGGLRADLPKGPLLFGALYEAMPFDNRVATFSLTAAELERVFERNLTSGGGILSVAGVRVQARCRNGSLDVELFRDRAGGAGDETAELARKRRRKRKRDASTTRLPDDARLTVVTNDYLALRGDKVLGVVERTGDALSLSEALVRDEIVAYLEALARSGSGSAAAGDESGKGKNNDEKVSRVTPFSPDVFTAKPRIVYPGRRPVRCNRPAESGRDDSSGRERR